MNGRKWTQEDDDYLRRVYKQRGITATTLGPELGRTARSVRLRAFKLGISATEDSIFGAEEIATEEWRPVEGFPPYQISSLGRLRGRWGNAHRLYATRKGYESAGLYRDGKPHQCSIHVLVAEAFIGPRPGGCEVTHGDGIRRNNRVDNLSYKTPTENAADKLAHGTDNRGEKNPQAKLTAAQVLEIRGAYRKYSAEFGGPALAKKYGVHPMTILRVAQGTAHWSHLTEAG